MNDELVRARAEGYKGYEEDEVNPYDEETQPELWEAWQDGNAEAEEELGDGE